MTSFILFLPIILVLYAETKLSKIYRATAQCYRVPVPDIQSLDSIYV